AVAAAEPDELAGLELRGHVHLLQPEQPAVERAHLVVRAGREAERDVLEPHRPDRSRRRRDSVSSVTAASRMIPVMMYCVAALEPSRPSPFAIVMITSEPSSAETTRPRPPKRLVPPITAAAIAFRSSAPPPVVRSTADRRAASTIPPSAAI